MIRSMTAFARCQRQIDQGQLIWEVRSVNHRYLEVHSRLPEDFRALETTIREKAGTRLHRGKVDCSLTFRRQEQRGDELQLNQELVQQLAHLSREVDGMVFSTSPVNSLEILKWPGVLEVKPVDLETVQQQALELLDEALEEMVAVRGREGEGLRQVIEERCAQVRALVDDVRQRMPAIAESLRQRLLSRFNELKLEVDEDRLAQEVAFMIQKMDVDEEMQRLGSHLDEVLRIVAGEEGGAVGRRLDFLMQELNREANTLCSKSVDADTTQAGVEMKVLIEQMREQVQNVE